jgi:SAM-dependent methyltransferase
LDISGPMLAMAISRARSAGLENVRFERGDAQVHGLPGAGFDTVVSRFGVMFFDDPHAAFANLARSLRSGGRVVVACWQDLLANEWPMVPAGAAVAYVPMPDLGEAGGPARSRLPTPTASAPCWGGLAEVSVDDFRCLMPMGATVDDTVAFMQGTDIAARLIADVSEDVAGADWEAVRAALAPYAGHDGVVLGGDAWIVTATKPR